VLQNLYSFHKQLIIRLPAAPFELDIAEADVPASLHDARFMESIYLASPALHDECEKWRRGELTDARKVAKLRSALTRYYVRARSRCTPFGLFAGCAVAEWGPASQVVVEAAKATRHTRLDMHYLCDLAQQLAAHPTVRPHLRYWPNTSLYQLGQEFRFVEHHYAAGRRVHQLSAVQATPYLQELLAATRGGASYPALVALLTEAEVEPEEAAQFVDALIEAQVLMHELEPTVTGEEFFSHVLAVLARVSEQSPALATITTLLEAVRQQLAAIDQHPVNLAAAYADIVAALAPLGVALEPGKLFQVDAVPGLGAAATLDAAWQRDLLEAVDVLARLAPPPTQPRLAAFRQRFQARYETQEVPLLEALDNESGISYTEYGSSSYSPLVHDLVTAPDAAPSSSSGRTRVQQQLHEKLREAERTQQYSLDLALADLPPLLPTAPPLPPSLAILFRVIDGQRLFIESVGGSSAVNLLGRFAHADPAIARLVGEVAAHEQAHNPAVAFAEICHLPVSRAGNLLQRPCFRALEIPYLAQSGLPAEGQVPVQDLLLSVRQGELRLRSRSTGQYIIPRLGTAHNFTHEALPVYQFLCDLQTQGLQAQLSFGWEAGASYTKFLPRLTYRNVVLAAASWQLTAADVAPLLAGPAALAARWPAFCQQWRLPRFFTLADGDNELLVDTESPLLVATWLDTIRQRPQVLLKEFLFDPAASPVRDAAGRPYLPQVLAVLLRQQPSYPGLPQPPALAALRPVQREFPLGSEWLYYKLYCGQKVANRVLLAVVQPLTEELLAQGLIDNWFFIRYADPDNHLRLRLHLPDPACLGAVVQLVAAHLQPHSTSGAIWKVQTDTYRRELERYGAPAIGLAEQLFGYQSTAYLGWLATEPPADEDWLFGLAAMAELLHAFDYTHPQKITLLAGLRESFGHEFGLDKKLKLQLDAKYRLARPAIQEALHPVESLPPPAPLQAIARQVAELAAAGQLPVSTNHLLGAYLHMLLNRIIPAEARLHELVLYDFLGRYYQSQQALQRAG
jgi:thiopeptide-type bacteriocin biosynthesis protein